MGEAEFLYPCQQIIGEGREGKEDNEVIAQLFDERAVASDSEAAEKLVSYKAVTGKDAFYGNTVLDAGINYLFRAVTHAIDDDGFICISEFMPYILVMQAVASLG